jgi:hypothetical protein
LSSICSDTLAIAFAMNGITGQEASSLGGIFNAFMREANNAAVF